MTIRTKSTMLTLFLTWGRLTHDKPMQPQFIYEPTPASVASLTELRSTNNHKRTEVHQTAAAGPESDKNMASLTTRTNSEGGKDGEESTESTSIPSFTDHKTQTVDPPEMVESPHRPARD